MTLATLFLALIATPAAAGPGEATLLDVQAEWCGPCRQMRPAIDQLSKLGYPIKAIDIDQSRDVAQRYGVDRVPTFVVVDASGKELDRTAGLQSPRDLATFFNNAVAQASGRTVEPAAAEVEAAAEADSPPATEPAEPEAEGEPAAPPRVANPKPWETTVRIKMHVSAGALIFGSGTIIHSDANESIILTCAHIFKVDGPRQMTPKQYNRRITVDLFDGQLHGPSGQQLHPAQMDIPGEAIDYDFTHDVGLIRIRPGRKLAASRVVPPEWEPRAQTKMVTVGCSNGKDATAWNTRILSPRVNMSNTETRQPFTTIKCAFQPKEGRSGGGLYTMDGYVAGVCDFADPNEHTGLYATPESIHALLDRNRMMALYRPARNGSERLIAANGGNSRRPGGMTPADTIVRAQSGESEPAAPGRITLPPPSLSGVKMPRPETQVASAGRRPRPTPRLDDLDPNAPGSRPIATDAEVETDMEERFSDQVARSPRRGESREEPETTAPAPATQGKWSRATHPWQGKSSISTQP